MYSITYTVITQTGLTLLCDFLLFNLFYLPTSYSGNIYTSVIYFFYFTGVNNWNLNEYQDNFA